MNESDTKRYSLDDIRRLKGATDWDRLKSAADHKGAQEIDVDWSSVRVVEPDPKQMISLRVDMDVLAFFKSGGKGYQTRMNAVLRAYKDAMEKG